MGFGAVEAVGLIGICCMSVVLSIGDARLLPGTPRIVAPIFRGGIPESELRAFARQGGDIAEIRLDLAGAETPGAAADLARAVGAVFPVIVTARAAFEGGRWKGDESARLAALAAALEFADAVDIELAAEAIRARAVDAAHAGGKRVIMSRHNFGGTDSRAALEEALQNARDHGADIFKIACAVADKSDAARMLDFVRERRDEFPLIATAMGEGDIARRTRLELARNGSLIAFAAADGASAPGQQTLAETVAALRGD